MKSFILFEEKSTKYLHEFYESEQAKILCGKAYFQGLGVGYDVATKLEEVTL